MTSGLERNVSLKPSWLLCLLAINWPTLSIMLWLFFTEKPSQWHESCSPYWSEGSQEKGRLTSGIWPALALHCSSEMPSLPGRTHHASTFPPFTFYHGTWCISDTKKNSTNWTFPFTLSASGWVKEVGKSTSPGSWGHLISVPLPIASRKPVMWQASGVSPDPKTCFEVSGGSQPFSLHSPFPIALHGASWQPWRKMEETRPPSFPSPSLSLPKTPVQPQRELLVPVLLM